MTAPTTPRLDLPFLQAGQALKNITHNEALQRLDSGLYLSCSNMAADALPSDPVSGVVIIISETPDTTLLSRIGQIAVFLTESWVWFLPKSGWTIWDEVGETLQVFDGQIWVGPTPGLVPDTLPHLGLNASASTSQRLAVASDTSLFSHDGDSHRLTLNRAATSDTASLLFQTNFAGDAELGLTGADGFSIKTSSDGTSFANRMTTPDNYSGIRSPAFGSMRVTVANDAAQLIATPATGGLVVLTIISDNGFPQVGHSGIFAYDTGTSPGLITLAATSRAENHGSTILNGTISIDGNIGVSAVVGGIYLENRIANSRDISLTFLC